MKYSKLAEVYQKLEKITGKLKMTEIVADLFKTAPDQDLPLLATLIRGSPFPAKSQKELEMGNSLVKSAISVATGASEEEIDQKWKETGDLGSTMKYFLEHRKQVALLRREITVEMVRENLVKIAEESGPGSQDRKIKLLAELITSSTPLEAKYIVRTVLGELRVGVGEGIVRDAIAQAFEVDSELVERGYFLTGDYGRVIAIAKKAGENGLRKISLELGTPIKVMLAQKVESIKEGFKTCGSPAQFEFKYDGFRIMIHKKDSEIKLFSRRLEDVTNQFPEIIEWSKKSIKAKEAIVEGETIGIDKETGKPIPFQELSKRIKRKYKIQRMAKEVPAQVNLFDLIYLNGKDFLNVPFKKRREKLEEILDQIPEKFQLAERLVTGDPKTAERFYKKALAAGQEGVMIKNLEAPYQPGSRVGYMVKLKPIMETLDLVVTGGIFGEGKRAKWISSYLLAARDPDTGRFIPVGKMATGLTEEQFEQMTKMLKPLIIREKGKRVDVKPKIVVEVGYEEIQKSPKYESGYALRFPRLIRLRTETKKPEDADTIERIASLYKKQPGRKK